MTQAHTSLHLAFELLEVVWHAGIGTLDIAPYLVDENTRDDPEYRGNNEEDLESDQHLQGCSKLLTRLESKGRHTVCMVFIRFLTFLQCVYCLLITCHGS